MAPVSTLSMLWHSEYYWLSITNHKSRQDAPFSTGWFKPEGIFNQVLIVKHLSVDGAYIRQSGKWTHDTADFNVCIFRSSQLSVGFLSALKSALTLFLQVNFTRGEGASGWQASCGRVPHPTLQERGSPLFRKPAMAPRGRGRLWVWGRGAPTTASIPGY